MTHNPLLFQTIEQVSTSIKERHISPVELTQQTLARIEQLNPSLNAFLHVTQHALEQAKNAEQDVMAGHYRGPLHGVPISIKDIFETKGQVTTAGSKILANWTSTRNATVVEKLQQAGAIIIGKNNMHEFSSGGTNENPHYGAVRNPWDPAKISGGSSGGSAVAVATAMSFGAVASDVGGSIRLPAAQCGVVGIKPTYGRVSRFGSWPFSFSADHIGTMGRTVKDAAYVLQAIAGYDALDPTTVKRQDDIVPTALTERLDGVVIGICRDYFFDDVDVEMATHIERAITQFEQLGAVITDVHIPYINDVPQQLLNIMRTEWYGVHKPFIAQYADEYGEDLRSRFEAASSITAQQYLDAQKFRKTFIHIFAEQTTGIDILLSPTLATFPFNIGSESIEEKEKLFRSFKTHIFNFTGFPAISLPAGLHSNGLPVGLQMMGKPFQEQKLLTIAATYERHYHYNEALQHNTAYYDAAMMSSDV